MSTPPAVAALLAESLDQERAGDMSAVLQRAREALERAHAAGDPHAIAEALAYVARVWLGEQYVAEFAFKGWGYWIRAKEDCTWQVP